MARGLGTQLHSVSLKAVSNYLRPDLKTATKKGLFPVYTAELLALISRFPLLSARRILSSLPRSG